MPRSFATFRTPSVMYITHPLRLGPYAMTCFSMTSLMAAFIAVSYVMRAACPAYGTEVPLCEGLLGLLHVAVVVAGLGPDLLVGQVSLQVAVQEHGVQLVPVGVVAADHGRVVAALVHGAVDQAQAVPADRGLARVGLRV